MNLRPLNDRVIIQPLEAESKTPGGIVLPDVAKEKPQRGKVVAVGPGRILDDGTRAAISVTKGDEVLFARYGGDEVKIEDVSYRILHESEILAILG